MPGIIMLSDQENGSNTDILQGTRLQTVPAGGFLTFELEASDNDATNNMSVSIQLPGGDTPLEGVRVPATAATGHTGALNTRNMLRATFLVGQGGHTVFSCVEVGDTELTWRVTYSPAGVTL